MQNFAALCATVFPLLMKNLKGGVYPPPPRRCAGFNCPSLFWPLDALLTSRRPFDFSMPFWLLGALLTTYRPLSRSMPYWILSILQAAQNLLAGDAELGWSRNSQNRNILSGVAAGATKIF